MLADSVAIVDTAGVPVVTIERLEGMLDILALVNNRWHLRSLDVSGVHLELHKDFTGPWNISYIISGDPAKRVPAPLGPGYDVTIDVLRLSRGSITTIAPWAPNAVFKGAARDSVIAVRDSLHDILRTPNGLLERRQVTLDRIVAHDGIILQPSRAPSSIELDSLRGRISDPPVRIVGASGRVHWTPDSLRLELPHVALPASLGSASGRVWWNQPGPVRYDMLLQVQAGFSDLTWIWDVLPTTGGGSATVRMRTLESADDAEYALSKLDLTSMSSRITGGIDVIARPAEFRCITWT